MIGAGYKAKSIDGGDMDFAAGRLGIQIPRIEPEKQLLDKSEVNERIEPEKQQIHEKQELDKSEVNEKQVILKIIFSNLKISNTLIAYGAAENTDGNLKSAEDKWRPPPFPIPKKKAWIILCIIFFVIYILSSILEPAEEFAVIMTRLFVFLLFIPLYSAAILFFIILFYRWIIYYCLIKPYTTIIYLKYEFDENINKTYNNIEKTFGKIIDSSSVWNFVESNDTSVERDKTSVCYAAPWLLSVENVKVPFFSYKSFPFLYRTKLYFLPDRILITEFFDFSEYQYNDLSSSSTQFTFQESDSVPEDAKIVSKTWEHANKNGGPDKRFSDNKEITVCRYECLDILLGKHKAQFMSSKLNTVKIFCDALMEHKKTLEQYS